MKIYRDMAVWIMTRVKRPWRQFTIPFITNRYDGEKLKIIQTMSE